MNAFRPRYAAMADEAAARALRMDCPAGVKLEAGQEAVCALAALPEADVVVMGISGTAAIRPLLAAGTERGAMPAHRLQG